MASNPMQRKANMYLLIGVLVTLLITGSIIGILIMQHTKLQKEIDDEHNNMKAVTVLTKDVNSGDVINIGDVTTVKVIKSAAPSNAVTMDIFDTSSSDEDETKKEMISKLNLKSGTIITSEMLYEDEIETRDDLRLQEYNSIVLPSQLEDGQFVDIRLRLSDATDFVVLPKKKVTIPEINGSFSESTIRLEVTEDERLIMNNAMVDAYMMKGSMLYATIYTEAGMQENAKATYVASQSVTALIQSNPNIVEAARIELSNRYYGDTNGSGIRNHINEYVNSNSQRDQDVQSGIADEINKIKQERQSYLKSL